MFLYHEGNELVIIDYVYGLKFDQHAVIRFFEEYLPSFPSLQSTKVTAFNYTRSEFDAGVGVDRKPPAAI